MKLASLNQRIEAVQEEARNKVQAIADEFRVKRLIPFCRRHKLTYLAGNGRTVFYNKQGNPVYSTDLKALEPIEEILDIQAIGVNDVFGFYIEDIDEEDWG